MTLIRHCFCVQWVNVSRKLQPILVSHNRHSFIGINAVAAVAAASNNDDDDVSELFPRMTSAPLFVGPIEEPKQSVLCQYQYTDFRFECRVQYPRQSTDDGARFNVSLTFDGRTDPNNPDTHVVTDGTALNVSFPSVALKGNVGKSVICFISLR